MRKLILKMSLSVDGFVAGPNGELDWFFRTRSPEGMAWILELLGQAGTHIMGSRTFQDMAAYWPTSTDPLAGPMNEIPKVVFSRSGGLLALDSNQTTAALKDAMREQPLPAYSDKASKLTGNWADAYVARGDLAEEIMKLKQQPGKDILAHGGSRFARSLVKARLIDEYRLVIHPVILGKGLPLFSDLETSLDLNLVSTTVFKAGVVAQVYRPGA